MFPHSHTIFLFGCSEQQQWFPPDNNTTGEVVVILRSIRHAGFQEKLTGVQPNSCYVCLCQEINKNMFMNRKEFSETSCEI